jgi:hypothetical protein
MAMLFRLSFSLGHFFIARPEASAVKREAEEDWGKKKRR